MKRFRKSLLILVIVALLTVALPLAGAFAQTTQPNPTVQQPGPAPQQPYYYPNGFYCCGFGPGYGQMNPNYQQSGWYMGSMWY